MSKSGSCSLPGCSAGLACSEASSRPVAPSPACGESSALLSVSQNPALSAVSGELVVVAPSVSQSEVAVPVRSRLGDRQAPGASPVRSTHPPFPGKPRAPPAQRVEVVAHGLLGPRGPSPAAVTDLRAPSPAAMTDLRAPSPAAMTDLRAPSPAAMTDLRTSVWKLADFPSPGSQQEDGGLGTPATVRHGGPIADAANQTQSSSGRAPALRKGPAGDMVSVAPDQTHAEAPPDSAWALHTRAGREGQHQSYKRTKNGSAA
eukprot:scaffold2968_cov321-Pinguiococcus_pyrenoidosus.AAC.8